MTKEQNRFRQRVWQFKTRLKSNLAYIKIMKKISSDGRSEKGLRLIKTMLRSVSTAKARAYKAYRKELERKSPDLKKVAELEEIWRGMGEASPNLVERAAEWLMYLETGAKKVPSAKDLQPVTAEDIDASSPVLNPELNPDPTDPDIAAMLNKVRSETNGIS